jgi:hypothetical protein
MHMRVLPAQPRINDLALSETSRWMAPFPLYIIQQLFGHVEPMGVGKCLASIRESKENESLVIKVSSRIERAGGSIKSVDKEAVVPPGPIDQHGDRLSDKLFPRPTPA